ncbi:hypothetical protein Lbir_1823 [Legionella birminghamensis]|uniref:Protein of uncharacterized function (DUF2807) n=1 Tax=Legionella birminghamensis TaxID=28083 RepID=A0A378I667_9GAMM|nr:DUF2807 domain-containing protein [Legionella birminghamensis]KTC70240.1 hypothetical protein Lbir_1823 [Legionella birminghamensis]STX30352.1 Protein of uncharacterised function (DUF2807) [Legionella birminghamensis]
MLTRVISLICILFLLSACRHSAVNPAGDLPVPVNKTQQTRSLSSFNHVSVSGRLNVVLHTGYSKPQIILHGDPRDLAQVSTRVQNYTLVVNLGSGYPRYGSVTVDIRGRFLNTFRYEGAGIVTGPRLNSGLLDLYIENEGRTVLGGHINVGVLEVKGNGYTEINGVQARNLHLRMSGKPRVKLAGIERINTLDLEGDGALSMYWVKSDTLTIRAGGNAFIQLGGVANKIDVCLHDKARFNGRYLRAKRAFVKTYENSVAELSVVNRQHTLASDASNIYFYNIPEMKTDFMAFDGSVLDMRDLNDFFVQEYDRYNKQIQ